MILNIKMGLDIAEGDGQSHPNSWAKQGVATS